MVQGKTTTETDNNKRLSAAEVLQAVHAVEAAKVVAQRGLVGCDKTHRVPVSRKCGPSTTPPASQPFHAPNGLTSQLTSSNLRPSTAQLFRPPKAGIAMRGSARVRVRRSTNDVV